MALEYRCYRTYAVAANYEGTEKQVVIEAAYNDLPVLGICAGCFAGNQALEAVFVPECLEFVDDRGFYDCKSLRYIGPPVSGETLPDRSVFSGAMRQAGAQAFQGTGLKEVCFLAEDSLQLDLFAFRGCGALERVSLACKELSLGDGVFENCGIRVLSAPRGRLWTLPRMSFAGCKRLETVDLHFGVVEERCFYKCKSLRSLPRCNRLIFAGTNAFHESGISAASLAAQNKKTAQDRR